MRYLENRLVYLFLMVFVPSLSFSQQTTDLHFNLNVEETQLYLLDPIVFSFEIKNTTNKDITISNFLTSNLGLSFGYAWIEYCPVETDEWVKVDLLHAGRELNCGLLDRHTVLPPNFTFKLSKIILKQDFLFKYKQTPDQLRIRAGYMPLVEDTTNVLYSEIVLLDFLKYAGEDAKCFRYLKDLDRPDFFYSTIYNARTSDGIHDDAGVSPINYLKDAEYVLEKYPNSQFAPWAAVYLSNFHYQIASNVIAKRTISDVEPIESLIESLKYKKIAISYDNPKVNTYLERWADYYSIIRFIYNDRLIPQPILDKFELTRQ